MTGHPKPISFGAILDGMEQSASRGTAAGKAINGLLNRLISLAIYTIYMPAAMATPFLRHRFGIVHIAFFAIPSVMLAYLFADQIEAGALRVLMMGWVLALIGRWCHELVTAVIRVFKPGRIHVDRRSSGLRFAAVKRLWELTIDRVESTGRLSSLVGEPVLLLMLSGMLWGVERLFGSGQLLAFWVPLAAAISIIVRSLVDAVSVAWQLTKLADQEQEQTDLAERFSERTRQANKRDVDGVVKR